VRAAARGAIGDVGDSRSVQPATRASTTIRSDDRRDSSRRITCEVLEGADGLVESNG